MNQFENEYTWGKAVVSNSTDKFHIEFDNAIDEVRKELGKKYPIIINGKEIYTFSFTTFLLQFRMTL